MTYNRNEQLRLKYQILVKSGFTSEEAKKYKHHAWPKVHAMALQGKKWIAQRNEFFKRLDAGKVDY